MSLSEKKYTFQKLTPIKNVNLDIYKDAINYALQDEDIRNIAISGPYSAGKSSVIETYKNENTKYRYLHISLSHFENTERDLNNLENVTIEKSTTGYTPNPNESILEGKILNQLIHQSDADKIPQSNFKLKQKVSKGKTAIETGLFILFLILLSYIIFFNRWSDYVLSIKSGWIRNPLMWTLNSELLLFSGILTVGIVGMAVYNIITIQKNKNIFRKLNFQGNEIEIFEENDDSYFDKYLNEVLYLFENSGADVIIFEDMDRYNLNRIFEKLREINTLINNKMMNKGKSPIRFVYLLKDDIFSSKDRTKFFDFIIPIVPVVDGSNSYDQFISHFKKGGILKLFKKKFLQGLSLYIDDMRILKNVYNEFIIYHNRIKEIELNSNKLLAIVVYKNIFPKDFSDLQLGLGFVHTLFENKAVYVQKELESLNEKINKIESRINSTNNEILSSIEELDAVFLLSNHHITMVGGVNASKFKTRVELVRAIRKSPDDVYHLTRQYGNRPLDISNELGQLEENSDYNKRKKNIKRQMNDQIEKLKMEKINLVNKRNIIQNGKLKDIITKENIDEIFSVTSFNEVGEENKFEEIKASSYFPLIKYLVRNGLIDETYSDYMTYFYENSLSRIDKNFLLSVTDQLPKEYAYSLKSPKLVLSMLRSVDFNHVEILNFDLLCYLLQTQQHNNKYLIRFIEQIMNTRNFKFINEFLETQRETALFIEALNEVWAGIFNYISQESNLSREQMKQYAVYTLYYSQDDIIKRLNINSDLSEFISNSPDFLDIDNPNIDKLISGFLLINVKFKRIEFKVSNKELFKMVYRNNLYQIRFDLITLILENVYGYMIDEDFKHQNYTLIMSKKDEPLAKYINDNINQYIQVVLNNCNKCINDKEFIVLQVLNNSDINIDNKKEYITNLHTKIEKIENVQNEELWDLLLERKRITYSEINMLHYFFEKGLTPSLIEYINNSEVASLKLANKSIDSNYGRGSSSNLFNAIVTCNELLNERYESILRALNIRFTSFTETQIEEDKIKILIKLDIIPMNDSILLFMRKHYSFILIDFIIHNIDQYTKSVISNENFDMHETLSVIEQKVDDLYKLKLLQFTTEEITLIDKDYTDPVKLYIIENNLNKKDIPFLVTSYPTESYNIKTAIMDMVIKYIDEVLNGKPKISTELLEELFESNRLNIGKKKSCSCYTYQKLIEIRREHFYPL